MEVQPCIISLGRSIMQRRERNIILVWMLAVTDCLYLILVISTLGDVGIGMMSSMNLTGGQKCLQWDMTRKSYSIKVVYFLMLSQIHLFYREQEWCLIFLRALASRWTQLLSFREEQETGKVVRKLSIVWTVLTIVAIRDAERQDIFTDMVIIGNGRNEVTWVI